MNPPLKHLVQLPLWHHQLHCCPSCVCSICVVTDIVTSWICHICLTALTGRSLRDQMLISCWRKWCIMTNDLFQWPYYTSTLVIQVPYAGNNRGLWMVSGSSGTCWMQAMEPVFTGCQLTTNNMGRPRHLALVVSHTYNYVNTGVPRQLIMWSSQSLLIS